MNQYNGINVNGTLTLSGGMVLNRRAVSGTYSVVASDYMLSVTSTAMAFTITLPSVPTTARVLIVKDESGGAATGNITLSGTIDGATNYVINTNYGMVVLYYNGSGWSIIHKEQTSSATSKVIGRKSSGAGAFEECTLSEILDFIGSAAQGDILYRGSSTWARLAAGTSGYFLKTLGSSNNPTWALCHSPRGYIDGLTLTRPSTTTIGIAAGVARDSSNTYDLSLSSAWTKSTSAWAAGTGNGSLDTGAVGNNKWYHVYLISQALGASPDILLSLNPVSGGTGSPTMPTNYTLSRRIGSVRTNGSAQLLNFVQDHDMFQWMDVQTDIDAVTVSNNTTTTHTLGYVPLGIRVCAIVCVAFTNSSQGGDDLWIGDINLTTANANATGPTRAMFRAPTAGSRNTNKNWVCTDNQARVYSGNDASAGTSTVDISIIGWEDPRGRNA